MSKSLSTATHVLAGETKRQSQIWAEGDDQVVQVEISIEAQGEYVGTFGYFPQLQKEGAESLTANGKNVQIEFRIKALGHGAKAHLEVGSWISDSQKLKVLVIHDHGKFTDTKMETVFRSVVEGRAQSEFRGRVLIPQGADRADSSQSAKSLLLSREGRATASPELEISHDNVKCAHGAAISNLDPEQLYYLQSRGLDRQESERILVRGFLSGTLEESLA